MTVDWKRSQASIGHLTLRSRSADTNVPALRLRTERLLSNIDLQPRGLPPGSLLIVQKVYASTPLSSSTTPQSRWAEHLHAQVETLYRTAVRPALGPVPLNATSVLFADAAEMLACLTRDILNGRVWQQWYWQHLLRHVPHTSGAALTATWSEQAAFVPTMLAYLKLEEVRAAIALLSPSEISAIVGALNASFDLPLPMQTPVDEYSPILPPWRLRLSSLSTATLKALTPQAHYLLGLIVTLHHAPAFARSPNFMAQAISWLETVELRDDKPIIPAMDETDDTNDFIFGESQPFPTEGLITELGGILYLIHLLKWLELPASWAESAMLVEHLGSWGTVELLARGLLGEMYERYVDDPIWDVLAMLDGREKPRSGIGHECDPQQGGDKLAPLLWTSFRLPAKWLKRYALSCPSWIAATDGQRLYLVDEEAGYLVVDVPLEERSLDEVVDMEVGEYRAQGIQASIERVGAGEVEMWGGGSCGRPWVESVLHAHSVSNGNPGYAGGHNRPYAFACPDVPIHPHALWWHERVLGFIRHLLVRALSEPAIDEQSLPEALLCKRGRLIAGRTHVDLYMPMDQVSLPVRRAGLDRDPGWVPDLGRVVLFHFGQEI